MWSGGVLLKHFAAVLLCLLIYWGGGRTVYLPHQHSRGGAIFASINLAVTSDLLFSFGKTISLTLTNTILCCSNNKMQKDNNKKWT